MFKLCSNCDNIVFIIRQGCTRFSSTRYTLEHIVVTFSPQLSGREHMQDPCQFELF